MSMFVGDYNISIPGLAGDYKTFREKYYSIIDGIWTALFNKEDIANKSDKIFDIGLYNASLKLAHIVKEQYLLGYNNTTITGVDVAAIRNRLEANGIDFDAILTSINCPEKVFSLMVNDDGVVEDTVGGREIDTDNSTSTTYTVSTLDGLDIFTPTGGVIYYPDTVDDLQLDGGTITQNYTLKVIGKLDDTTVGGGSNIITSYQFPELEIKFRRVNTVMRITINTETAEYVLSMDGAIDYDKWVYLVVNIKRTAQAYTDNGVTLYYEITAFKNSLDHTNGIYGAYKRRVITQTAFFIPVYTDKALIPRIKISGDSNQTDNKYHEISWYRGQFSKEDMMKDYLYYKNLITI